MTQRRRRIWAALVVAVITLASFGAAVAAAVDVNVDISFELTGLGSGRVQSLDADFEPDGLFDCQLLNGQIDDPSHCHATVGIPTTDPNLRIRITPGAGSLGCWQGTCAPDVRQLLVPVTGDTVIAVRFDRMKVDLTVHKTGSGTGNIFGTEGDIDCGKRCSVTLEYGYQMLLSAVPDAGSKFDGWTGACAGQPQDCLIGLIADTDTTARFTLLSAGTSGPPPTTPKPTTGVTPTESPSPSAASSSDVAPGSPEASPATPGATPGPSPAPVSTTGDGDGSLLLLLLGGGGVGVLVAWLVYRLLARQKSTPAGES